MKRTITPTERVLRGMQDILREDLARATSPQKRKAIKARIYTVTERLLAEAA